MRFSVQLWMEVQVKDARALIPVPRSPFSSSLAVQSRLCSSSTLGN